jgi:hypothetical protein
MGAFLGLLIAALIGSFLVYLGLHWAVFKRIVPDPFTSRILAAVSGYLAGATVAGFGVAGGDFRWDSFFTYLFMALIVLALAIKKGSDERSETAEGGLHPAV